MCNHSKFAPFINLQHGPLGLHVMTGADFCCKKGDILLCFGDTLLIDKWHYVRHHWKGSGVQVGDRIAVPALRYHDYIRQASGCYGAMVNTAAKHGTNNVRLCVSVRNGKATVSVKATRAMSGALELLAPYGPQMKRAISRYHEYLCAKREAMKQTTNPITFSHSYCVRCDTPLAKRGPTSRGHFLWCRG